MAVYILPYYDIYGTIDIEKVVAKSFHDAEDKFISLFVENYDIEFPDDFDDLQKIMVEDQSIVLGNIYDIDEFKY